ncbi:glycoside hydrolase family 9 [bacterium]|nr:MAG: glycoside hydrolase family 9 [bacterium]
MLLAATMLLASAQSAYPTFAVPRLEGVTIKGLPAVTGRIGVDQFGYLPDGDKVAVISDPQKGYNEADAYIPGPKLEIRSRKGKTVLTGTPKPWKGGAVHEDSGDRGWWLDFSKLTMPGEYYVYDPSTKLRSPVFKIGNDVYRPILKAAVRMYYYQRLAVPILKKHAEGPWVDQPAYLQDRQTRSVEKKDDRSLDRDLSGGWMDAGDTDKYPPFNSDVIHGLLYAYRANPKAFTDDFNIPESGNGRPDLLDEVKFEMDWLAKMQFPDGSLPVKMGNIDYNGKYPLSQDVRPRYYGPKDSGATITACALYAHTARIYGGFAPWKGYANDLRARALRAWSWYKANPRTYKTDTGEIKSGIANRSAEDQDRLEAVAAIHLFALTGDAKYQSAIREKAGKMRQLSEGVWSPYEATTAESLLDYARLPKADQTLKAKIRSQLTRSAKNDHFAPPPATDLYRAWMEPTNYHWGSSTVRATWGVVALQAEKYADAGTKQRLRQRAADMLHSFHGVNPLSAVYLSNMGKYGAELSMREIYHARYGEGTPFLKNPPPGYVVGGPNQQYGGNAETLAWVKKQPRAKAYADTAKSWPEASWELSEPAIYYQAAYIRLLTPFVR